MLEDMLKIFDGYTNTCSIMDIKDKCVTFIRDTKYLEYLIDVDKDVWIIAPKWMEEFFLGLSLNIKFCFVDDPNYVFTIYHNEMYKNLPQHLSPSEIIKGKNCIIHPTAVIGVEGIKLANAPDGSKIQFKNIGNVIIEDDVEIAALTVVHRASITSTIIKRGVKIGARNNIGHNTITGENTVLAAGSIVGGSVMIGKNCWISMGSVIRNGVSICDDVVIGMGSLVLKDITEPGIYYGRPLEKKSDKTDNWNF